MAASLKYLIMLFFLCKYICHAYKFLVVFPLPSRSHQILAEGYIMHLSRAGHEITYITPFPMKNVPRGVRQIDVSDNGILSDAFISHLQANRQLDLITMIDMLESNLLFFNATFHIDMVHNLLHDMSEKFDAVIVEWLYTELYSGFRLFPFIWSSSLEPHSMVLSLIDEYLNPAYTVHHLFRGHYGFNFWQRAYHLWTMLNIRFLKWRTQSNEEQLYIDIFQSAVTKRGRTLPAYEDVKYNSSLILGNSYISSGEAISLPQNYKHIGGYHIQRETVPLPKEVQKIMDNAKHGVIYFSMGSMLQSSLMPKNLIRDIFKIFSVVNQTVIWKFEEGLRNLPENVHVLPWAPQLSILAHPNCVLFITHGGLLSKHEALHYGVPMIGVPHYLDQFMNINSAQNKGFAKRVDLYRDGVRELDLAIREILGNSRYRERVKEYSFIHHHRPALPEKELVHWVEHVVMTRGAMHLRSPALTMPWYQKYYVDLAALTLLLCLIIKWLFKQGRTVWKGHLKKLE